MLENFYDGEDIVLYSLDEIEKLPDKLYQLLNNKNLADIVEKGWIIANERYTSNNLLMNF